MNKKTAMSRRKFFTKATSASAAVAAGSMVTNADAEEIRAYVNPFSTPSELEITDMRTCSLDKRHFIRIDTNQDIYGYGEIRDQASATYALMLKSRILGMNPCDIDKIFRRIKQFGGHARQGGGVCAVEMACFDLAGKAWGVPCWQLLGGKHRDKIRVYCDTTWSTSPTTMGNRLKGRMDLGFTYLKMDLQIRIIEDLYGAVTYPIGQGTQPYKQWGSNDWEWTYREHPFTGIRITDKGIDAMAEYVAGVREIVGYDIPLATDHYGHFGIEDGIKLTQALEPFQLAWIEDIVPWWYTEQYKLIKDLCTTPILTGEDIYLTAGFKELIDQEAIDLCHPDIATSGGLMETKKLGDYAMDHGVGMAMHMAGNPVTMFASVHCAAATKNFIVMEHHNVDDTWYDGLVTGPEKPFVQDGYVTVPDSPGLGIELDEDAVRSRMSSGTEYFGPSDEWDDLDSHDRLWSKPAIGI